MYRYLKTTDSSDYALSWTSRGLSDESIKPPLGPKTRIKFSGSCLKQGRITYIHGKIVNICIVYEINKKDNTISSDPTLENCSFGAVTLTKKVDIDRYGYSGYGIGFDRKGSFSFSGGGYGQKVLIFGVDMKFSTLIDNKKIYILVLGWGPTQALEHTLTAEKMYSIDFTEKNKKCCLSFAL